MAHKRMVIRQSLAIYGELLVEGGGSAAEWVDAESEMCALPLNDLREQLSK